MYSTRKLNKIRKELKKSLDFVLGRKTEYTIEDVLTSYAEEYKLTLRALSNTSLILYEPGSEYLIQCDIVNEDGYGNMVLTTRKATAPLA